MWLVRGAVPLQRSPPQPGAEGGVSTPAAPLCTAVQTTAAAHRPLPQVVPCTRCRPATAGRTLAHLNECRELNGAFWLPLDGELARAQQVHFWGRRCRMLPRLRSCCCCCRRAAVGVMLSMASAAVAARPRGPPPRGAHTRAAAAAEGWHSFGAANCPR